ncbi:hypothetical protein CHLRE_10g426335v5 [Chlamydomonas reinhardtii]|uniref:CW-type domain-containing protein n=1 Tax=Chlamydomonas reinhardtii TaxID=3055 RepID=A0A2K3D9J4_CHLRE|nr:uncharacterized protein CHLRE_10g426335v5 [Chlamydomonas reinhardtii]PNW77195.1 hypothetical protein CHLRE_10g426335v5 [Chlamydomonas reinhardtii]
MATEPLFISGISHIERRKGEHIPPDALVELYQQHKAEQARILAQAQAQAQAQAKAAKAADGQLTKEQLLAIMEAQRTSATKVPIGRGSAAAPAAGGGRGGHHHHHHQGRTGGGGRGRGGGAAAAARAKAAAARKYADDDDDEADGTDQWVQCSLCQQWRQVPDEFWQEINNADEDEDWTCKDAKWPVVDYEPGTPACC